ncbi:MAG: hypothetical protein IPP51_12735 [Bacteroidetes bacterium]|nr:hypothetical protein [Bacteroidota bacterium]
MQKIFLFVSFFCLSVNWSIAQDPSEYIKANAVRMEAPDKLNDSIYNLLSPYRIILLGEMHGINESAQFVGGLIDLFTESGDSVLLGMEIPSQYMKSFLAEGTDSSVYASDFFSNLSWRDGRQSTAWADLIVKAHRLRKCKVFFFDINDSDGKDVDRDFVMYKNIKAQCERNQNFRIITLSGNYHNPTKSPEEKTMGYYVAHDSMLVQQSALCSLNIYFIKGQMRNDSGNGLELKSLDKGDDIFTKTLSWDYFIMMANPKKSYPYTGIYFVKTITAAAMVKELK